MKGSSMRLFEIVLLVLVGMALLRPFLGGLRKILRIELVSLLGLISLLAHLLIEGSRWQMVPVYVLIGTFSLLALVRRFRPVSDKKGSLGQGILGVIILIIVLLPLLVFPVPKLIEPTGPYLVGTTTLYFRDDSREEIYSSSQGDVRELNVQIWYPAEANSLAEPAPYMGDLDLIAPAFARFLGLPSFVLNHVSIIETHSFLEAPVASDGVPYPVLVFSHGWGGTRTQSTYLMEELASHGYVVIALDHTYGALVTVFPDDRVVLQKSDILSHDEGNEEFDLSGNPLMSVWSADVSFVLDQLEIMNEGKSENPFVDKLDLDRVGLMGHSTGGGNAVQVCWLDPRCKVGLVMDAWLMPVSEEVFEDDLTQPFMFLWSEDWGSEENKERFQNLYQGLQGDAYQLEIEGTRHYDFSDLPLLSPLSPWFGLKGPINGERVLGIINAYVVAYFDKYLLGIGSPLLDGPSSQYPEVEFEAKGN
jgi:pimeloyl-ACP methyl ester carboxylesterase